jgi:HSP20 family protein
MNLIRRKSPVYPGIWNSFLDSDLFDTSPATFNSDSLPAVNVKETKDAFVLELAAPGMKKEDFKIEIENEVLTIYSKQERKEVEEKENYSRREFHYASFERSFTLPKSVDGQLIRATYQNGLLEVNLPKREEEKLKAPRMVKVG